MPRIPPSRPVTPALTIQADDNAQPAAASIESLPPPAADSLAALRQEGQLRAHKILQQEADSSQNKMQHYIALCEAHPAVVLTHAEYLAMGAPRQKDIAHLFRNPSGEPAVVYLTHGDGHSGLTHCLTGHDDAAKQKRGGNRGHLSDYIRLRSELGLPPEHLEIVEAAWHATFGQSGRTRNLALLAILEENGIWPAVKDKIIGFIERAVKEGQFVQNDVYGHYTVRFNLFRVYVTRQGYITSAQWKYAPREISLNANRRALALQDEAIDEIRRKLDSHHPLDLKIVGRIADKPGHLLLALQAGEDETHETHYLSWVEKTNTYTLVPYKYTRASYVDDAGKPLPKDAQALRHIGEHTRLL